MIIQALLAAAFFLLSPLASADRLQYWNKGSSITVFENNPLWSHASASIRYSSGGVKTLAFELHPMNPAEQCLAEYEVKALRGMIGINNQLIKTASTCLYQQSNGYVYYLFTPTTEAGLDLTVNAFRQGQSVTVAHELYAFTISGEGFAAAWENSLGNAL